MSKTPGLKSEMIPIIVEMVKLRMPWKYIAMALGIADRTLRQWRRQGREDIEDRKSTNARKLAEAIDQAKAELIEGYIKVVQNEALNGKTITIEKQKENEDGSIVTERTTKTEPPNATLALKILGMELPDEWGETRNLNVNWEESLLSQGKDPEKLRILLKAYIEAQQADEADDEPTTPHNNTP